MSRWWRLLISLNACLAPAASAAWLGVCSGEDALPAEGLLRQYASIQGERSALVVAEEALPNCTARELPLPRAAILAGRLLSGGLAKELGAGFALIGSEADGRFSLSDVVPPGEPKAAGPIPVGVELTSDLAVITFGAEGRARAGREAGRLTLSCRGGTAPAGMVLQMPYRGLPVAIPLAVSVDYDADGAFEWALSDARRAERGDPLPLATLPAARGAPALRVPPVGLDTASVESLTVACPGKAARLLLFSLKMLPLAAPLAVPPRALWAWQAAAWLETPERLLEKLAKAGADTLFATVPVDLKTGTVAEPAALERFVQTAANRGVRVWPVVGDPAAVQQGQRARFALFAAAYARYNREARPAARLAGVQFDIEPYLNAGYGLDPSAWQRAHLETLSQLKRVAELPVDAVVPYWWADQQEGWLLERLAAVVDSLTVMNYRTDPTQLKRFAQPFLEWGQRHGRAVRIALESGPVADEVQRYYAPAVSGEAALTTIGSHPVLLLLDRPRSFLPSGGQTRSFRFTHATPVSGGAVTFAGRPQSLLSLLPELEGLWGAWPVFAGVALHEFEP